MKTIFIIIGILSIGFITTQLLFMSNQNDTESYPYTIIAKYENIEIRSYEASLFTSVQLPTKSYREGSRQGFSILAEYIFGGNKAKEKIAMTSPVSMSLSDSMTVMFMVPKKYQKDNLPEPNKTEIEFSEQPTKVMAAIRFGGWADDTKIEKHKKQLIKALESHGIAFTDKFYFFGYNAPYVTVNRRNEIVVELPKDFNP